MAQKKRKHGKVEARKSRPLIRFSFGVLLLLILIAFGGCFALYMITATAQPDYWDREIIGSTEAVEDAVPTEAQSAVPSAEVNPVPKSERVDDCRMEICAWIGDVQTLTTYYQTASEMVFPDAVSTLSESQMRSIAKKLAKSKPMAIYLWMNTPAEISDVQILTESLKERCPEIPIYILSALPVTEDADASHAVNAWNEQLFSLADNMGLFYVDISTPFKGNDGFLSDEYADESVLYAAIGEEILTHVAD